MREIKLRVWHIPEAKMYSRGAQKVMHALVWNESVDPQTGGKICSPIYKVNYEDCVFMESSGILDEQGVEIYEGDWVEVRSEEKSFVGILEEIPDMFRSRGLHPLYPLLLKGGFAEEDPSRLQFRVRGNRYQSDLLSPAE